MNVHADIYRLFVYCVNSLTERFNQTLVNHLMRVINPEADDWDEYLQPIAFSFRCGKQASTQFSPFKLMYGVDARMPMELQEACNTLIEVQDNITPEDIQARLRFVTEKVSGVRDSAKTNIEAAQASQKRRYDIKHKGPEYQVGNKVLRYNRRRDTRMGDKLGQPFTGPYEIVEVVGRGVYRLKQGETILKQCVNASNLKLYHPSATTAASTHEDVEGQSPATPRSNLTPRSVSPPNTQADPMSQN